MDKLPRSFSAGDPHHLAWLLLATAGLLEASATEADHVAVALGFVLVERQLGTGAAHDLRAMRLCVRPCQPAERRSLVGRELARVALKLAGARGRTSAAFLDAIRLAVEEPDRRRWPRDR